MNRRPYKGYIKDDPNFKVLFENTVLTIGHIFESSFGYNKLTKEEFGIFEFDFDPTCALVGQNNDWCIVGGEVLVLKTWIDNTLSVVGELKWIFDLKPIDAYTVHILTDPWSNDSGIWQLSIDLNQLSRPLNLTKVKDFKKYVGNPYTDEVEW